MNCYLQNSFGNNHLKYFVVINSHYSQNWICINNKYLTRFNCWLTGFGMEFEKASIEALLP